MSSTETSPATVLGATVDAAAVDVVGATLAPTSTAFIIKDDLVNASVCYTSPFQSSPSSALSSPSVAMFATVTAHIASPPAGVEESIEQAKVANTTLADAHVCFASPRPPLFFSSSFFAKSTFLFHCFYFFFIVICILCSTRIVTINYACLWFCREKKFTSVY